MSPVAARLFSSVAIPYARMELPGWGKLLRATGGYQQEYWQGAGWRTVRGKWHGYVMDLDISNWSERQTYFLKRFYDLSTQLVLRALLREGDCLADIGANIGMITLLAAR